MLLRRDAVEDGLRIDSRAVLDLSSALGLSLQQLACCGRASLDLIDRGRNEVPLAHYIEEAEEFGRKGRADHPRVLPRIPINDLTLHILARNQRW